MAAEQQHLPTPFDQLVGSWQVKRHIEGDDAELTGEVIFTSLFDGHAFQDLWIVPSPDAWDGPVPTGGFRGTTIHYFGQEGELHSVWIDPDQQVSLNFSGKMDPTGYVITSTHEKIRAKWELRLTSASEASWHAYRRQAEGDPWTLWEVMQLTRLER